MRAIILDGSPDDDPALAAAHDAVRQAISAAGYEVESLPLRSLAIAPCAGDFGCWLRTPGECLQNDDARMIAAKTINAQAVVFFSPVSFGGYSSTFKRALDRLIPLTLPHFARINGETHHELRYDRYPALYAVGILPAPDPAAERIFAALHVRNTLNFRTEAHGSCTVLREDCTGAIRARVGNLLVGKNGKPVAPAEIPAPIADIEPVALNGPRNVLLLAGSQKGAKSTSEALLAHLGARIEESGATVSILRVPPAIRSDAAWRVLRSAFEAADTIVLACPLYVDCLPSTTIAFMERVAADGFGRAGVRASRRFAAIVNCGFPEASQCTTALAICGKFAADTGMMWAGGLALGGGEAIGGRAIEEAGGLARNVRRSLDLAAGALAAGGPIPPEATAFMAKPLVPTRLYTIMGGIGWRREARKYHTSDRLRDRPYVQ